MDFNELLGKTQVSKIINPIDIFENLDKEENKAYIRPGQKNVLELWDKNHRTDKDTIVKLHTGQGKTLIGLLMLQSLLNEGYGPALYLCPDKILVRQTINQAHAFGIKIVEVIDNQPGLPQEFLNSEAILIATCQKLFNGKSVFGVEGTGKEIKEIGAIVIDDAHRCLEIIRDTFSIKSKKYTDSKREQNPVYSELFGLFCESLKKQAPGTFEDIIQERDESFISVPFWTWYENQDEIMNIIRNNKTSSDIKFSWELIKNHLENCTCIFSGTRVEIVPRLIPINLIPSFSNAKRRIFLSATLTDDAFLIKDLAINSDSVLNPIIDKEVKYSGERLILLPTLVDPSLKREELITWLKTIPKKHGNFGVFTIVPSKIIGNDWKNGILDESSDYEHVIESLKEKIRNGEAYDHCTLINKYDGIDLPGHTCRILCLDSLPSYEALIDRYYQYVMPNTISINRKLAQRIEQGIGRAIRGINDYCIVVIIGTDISAFFSENIKRKYLSNEVQRQIKIGEVLAGELKKEGEALNAIEDLIEKVLNRDQGWKDFYKTEMSTLDVKPVNSDYIWRIKQEREAELNYQKGQPQKAISIVQEIINNINNDEAEKGWYSQLKAIYEYSVDKQKSLEIQLTAFNANSRLSRPPNGIQYKKLSRGGINRAQRISEHIKSKENYTSLILNVRNILEKVSFESSADVFEDGIDSLGKILGFDCDRPEKKTGKGPDNLWQISDTNYWIIECKNEVKNDRDISKTEAGQMATSIGWFKRNYEECMYIPIMIHPSKKYMYEADSSEQLYSIQPHNLEKLKSHVLSFYTSLSEIPFASISLEDIIRKITTNNLDSDEIKKTILSKVSK
ncbi:MAG: DEAD/DEAH box helicase family protein [Bacteroidales bacterium]|nr:DEAD/DEAH box helicase family protein [Bacteroidales bacterium]